jgi:hypothetical protein
VGPCVSEAVSGKLEFSLSISHLTRNVDSQMCRKLKVRKPPHMMASSCVSVWRFKAVFPCVNFILSPDFRQACTKCSACAMRINIHARHIQMILEPCAISRIDTLNSSAQFVSIIIGTKRKLAAERICCPACPFQSSSRRTGIEHLICLQSYKILEDTRLASCSVRCNLLTF